MENNNLTLTFNIHCDTDSEYSGALLSALMSCDKELNKTIKTLGKIEEAHGETQKALDEEKETHDETKKALEREIKAHRETKKALDEEKEAHGETKKALDEEKEAHDETKKALEGEKEAHDETKKALEGEKEAHDETKKALDEEKEAHDETKKVLDEEKEVHDETKKALEREIKAHNETKKEYEDKIFGAVTNLLDEICILLKSNIGSYNNNKLKEYVLSIINQSKGGWSECNTLGQLLYNLKVGSGAICRIINLIWWNKQENLQYMMSMVENINEIETKFKIIVELLKVAGHTIEYPEGVLSSSILHYTSYDDERSNFIDIFSSESYDNGVLCEIRLLSVDNSEGNIYIYYK